MTEPTIDELHAALVDELRRIGAVRSEPVAAAFVAVPRHLFVPDTTPARAYADDVVRTKTDSDGRTVSSVSQPSIVAMMLEQADLQPGMRVLEIGSGGYNAALIAELVGEDGEVTSVDIDPEVTERARACLAAAGYSRVNVQCVDGAHGAAAFAPFDRIIVTVEAADIPPAWIDTSSPPTGGWSPRSGWPA
ncbi:hypothetical protein GCM10010123_20140 [Pilimelia anulata]|uniref:Protein-L-isoaspartate O-methyltransferase n=1 Tax=Pilimelia anulata TaxID=53371 RepID=A0A8J3B984_9ACTN|nr:methyltransferase domain-containing protein [Pilimelia anulata]GGJ90308.1 hypothetical protein GCM10010123_20140 [Pilimelia anulata]